MTEDQRTQIAALEPAGGVARAALDPVQPASLKIVLPPGAPAFLAAVASLATCYGSILAATLLDVDVSRVMDPHLQAVLMWGFKTA
jgi:hypothetical protein